MGTSSSAMSQAAVMPLGAIPYDNLALPLVSPDGRFVATQTGVPPTWPTVLAGAQAEPPAATRIEIYALDRDSSAGAPSKPPAPPALLATLAEPAVLGRSCDARGFLIESPREDGSRWIGVASWTGEITWLVQGADVNAFATLGPGGKLAWSRRAVDAEPFDLVIRDGDQEWIIPAQEEDWLMPTWADSGRIFVAALTSGDLELRYAAVADAQAFRQSVQRFSVISDDSADVHTAYQLFSAHSPLLDRSRATGDRLVFFHPSLHRMAIWRPLAPAGQKAMQLNARSIAAIIDERDAGLITTNDELIHQSLRNPAQRVHLAAGPQVARPTPLSEWPFLLLNPGEGRIGLTAMRLLPPGQNRSSAAR